MPSFVPSLFQIKSHPLVTNDKFQLRSFTFTLPNIHFRPYQHPTPGAILFTLFLLYDFNRLAAMNNQGVNNWEAALRIAVSLYLDIINLLLEILEAMDN